MNPTIIKTISDPNVKVMQNPDGTSAFSLTKTFTNTTKIIAQQIVDTISEQQGEIDTARAVIKSANDALAGVPDQQAKIATATANITMLQAKLALIAPVATANTALS